MTSSQRRTQDDNSYTFNAYLDDVPFLFNKKYLPVNVPNHEIPDYDTTKVREILSRPYSFALEQKVLQEALDDVRRQKLAIEADASKRVNATTTTTTLSTSPQTVTNITMTADEHQQQEKAEDDHCQLSEIQGRKQPRAMTTNDVLSRTHYLPTPTSNQQYQRVSPPPPQTPQVSQQTLTPYMLRTVRDIYWPTGQNYAQSQPPTTINTPSRLPQVISDGSSTDIHVTKQPTPLYGGGLSFNNSDGTHTPLSTAASTSSMTTTLDSLSSTPSSILNPKSTNGVILSKIITTQSDFNDLSTFDPSLSDTHDPFHDAELKSINDIVALSQLYTTTSSTANTVRR